MATVKLTYLFQHFNFSCIHKNAIEEELLLIGWKIFALESNIQIPKIREPIKEMKQIHHINCIYAWQNPTKLESICKGWEKEKDARWFIIIHHLFHFFFVFLSLLGWPQQDRSSGGKGEQSISSLSLSSFFFAIPIVSYGILDDDAPQHLASPLRWAPREGGKFEKKSRWPLKVDLHRSAGSVGRRG